MPGTCGQVMHFARLGATSTAALRPLDLDLLRVCISMQRSLRPHTCAATSAPETHAQSASNMPRGSGEVCTYVPGNTSSACL